jgi:2,4-dienoyl-CoA reductase-like NADH-dependent reductase (Old Yellow Enzyme family)
MNSVDASASDSVSDVLEQIKLIAEAGIDFIEISGGTYENTLMASVTDALPDPESAAAKKTALRESFFLKFAKTVRETFPDLILMVTGGFRSRIGMEEALTSGACDLIGIARPAAVVPKLPKEIILNTTEMSDEEAHVALAPLRIPFSVQIVPIKQVGAGYQTNYYARQIQRMGRGLMPKDTRLRASERGRL